MPINECPDCGYAHNPPPKCEDCPLNGPEALGDDLKALVDEAWGVRREAWAWADKIQGSDEYTYSCIEAAMVAGYVTAIKERVR